MSRRVYVRGLPRTATARSTRKTLTWMHCCMRRHLRSNKPSLATRSGNLAVTTYPWSTVICMRNREMAVTAGMAASKIECEC